MIAKLVGVVGVGVFLLLAYWSVQFYRKYEISKVIVAKTVAFQKDEKEGGPSILVLGDSSGVGVGARTPELSVAGRLSEKVNASYVENRAVSGAVVADLPSQIALAGKEHYEIILIQIGGNDIVRFHNTEKTAKLLEEELRTLPKADKIILISAGDVGTALIFPPPVRALHSALNQRYHTEFAKISLALGITYANLFEAPRNSLFTTEPELYFAEDSFHPSGEGYGVWFEAVEKVL